MAGRGAERDAPSMHRLSSRHRGHDRPSPPPAPAPARAPVRVLLVEDSAAVAHRLRAVLNWQPEVYVCQTATNGHDALLATRRLAPAACLVSATIGPATALRLTDRLKRLAGAPHVLLYADTVEPVTMAAARLAGADGVVARDDDPAAIAHALAGIADGVAPPAPLTSRTPQRLADLTEDADRPIVTMLLLGIHPDEVARTLGIRSRALRSRRQHILYELDEALAVRSAAARLAAATF